MGKQNGKPGGKKHKRGKKETNEKRELLIREDGQEYGQVITMLGDMRLEVHCLDEDGFLYKKRVCKIRGKMRKRAWINKGDFVLISLRDFQDDKADVIHKYEFDEIIRLKALKEISETLKLNNEEGEKETDEGIVFGFSSDEEIDIDDI